MDLGMPQKDGFEASKEILQIQNLMKVNNVKREVRSQQFFENRDCEIVALTAFIDQKTKDTCKDIGVKEVLNKPTNVDMLMRLILIYHFKLNHYQYLHYLQLAKDKLSQKNFFAKQK